MAAEGALVFGAALWSQCKEYIPERPSGWLRTAWDILERIYHWVKDSAETHEQLQKIVAFVLFLVYVLVWVVFYFLRPVWVALCNTAALIWAALPFLLIAGLVVYAGILICKYRIELELILRTLKTNPYPRDPLIRIVVSYGSHGSDRSEIIVVPAYSTFGDVKKFLVKMENDRLKLANLQSKTFFRDNYWEDEEYLHKAGVKDGSAAHIETGSSPS